LLHRELARLLGQRGGLDDDLLGVGAVSVDPEAGARTPDFLADPFGVTPDDNTGVVTAWDPWGGRAKGAFQVRDVAGVDRRRVDFDE
jgi:hypothetical protein